MTKTQFGKVAGIVIAAIVAIAAVFGVNVTVIPIF